MPKRNDRSGTGNTRATHIKISEKLRGRIGSKAKRRPYQRMATCERPRRSSRLHQTESQQEANNKNRQEPSLVTILNGHQHFDPSDSNQTQSNAIQKLKPIVSDDLIQGPQLRTKLVATRGQSSEPCDRDTCNPDSSQPEVERVSTWVIYYRPDQVIEDWLSAFNWSRRALPDLHHSLGHSTDPTPLIVAASIHPSPGIESVEPSVTSLVSIQGGNFYGSLRSRNIFIDGSDCPTKLVQRATDLSTRRRASPEIDEATAETFRRKASALQTDGAQEIILGLAATVIPGLAELPDEKMQHNSKQLWSRAVTLPLDPDVLQEPAHLPKPKLDLAFGYSEAAFDNKQLFAMDHMVDQAGGGYAVPDNKLRFPFLSVEFTAAAKRGAHFVAINQVANAGSVALHGIHEFRRRVPSLFWTRTNRSSSRSPWTASMLESTYTGQTLMTRLNGSGFT
ncbi:MAG: hypothetical protein M1817_005800 [Caeruleum heppii]|nr:MAG: hypothetical protein M1817_005800 [Caeruleum heppii]